MKTFIVIAVLALCLAFVSGVPTRLTELSNHVKAVSIANESFLETKRVDTPSPAGLFLEPSSEWTKAMFNCLVRVVCDCYRYLYM